MAAGIGLSANAMRTHGQASRLRPRGGPPLDRRPLENVSRPSAHQSVGQGEGLRPSETLFLSIRCCSGQARPTSNRSLAKKSPKNHPPGVGNLHATLHDFGQPHGDLEKFPASLAVLHSATGRSFFIWAQRRLLSRLPAYSNYPVGWPISPARFKGPVRRWFADLWPKRFSTPMWAPGFHASRSTFRPVPCVGEPGFHL